MSRVLSTEDARISITRLAAVINGGFTDQISSLEQEGRLLSRPEVWDGPSAARFRGIWAEMEKHLASTRTSLDHLRAEIQTVNINIMTAGGS